MATSSRRGSKITRATFTSIALYGRQAAILDHDSRWFRVDARARSTTDTTVDTTSA